MDQPVITLVFIYSFQSVNLITASWLMPMFQASLIWIIFELGLWGVLSLRWSVSILLQRNWFVVPRKRQNNNQLCVAFKYLKLKLTLICAPWNTTVTEVPSHVSKILRIPDLPFLQNEMKSAIKLKLISSE